MQVEQNADPPFSGIGASPEEDLRSVGLLEFLDIDDRPVLVIDLANPTKTTPIYQNTSLQKIPLLESKIGDGVLSAGAASKDLEYSAFLDWAASSEQDTFRNTAYCGFWCTTKNIRNRWRIITGVEGNEYENTSAEKRLSKGPGLGRSQIAAMTRPSHSLSQSQTNFSSDHSLEAQIAAFRLREGGPTQSFPTPEITPKPKYIPQSETLDRLDFIKAYPSVLPSPHLQFFLEFDWESTELGSVSTWSTSLRRMVNILMSDPRPAAMYWGRQRTMMYNEPYVRVTGQRHPSMMGKTFSEAWAEIEGDFTPAFEEAYKTGVSFVIDDARFYIERHGYLEETYYSISIIPFLIDGDEIGL